MFSVSNIDGQSWPYQPQVTKDLRSASGPRSIFLDVYKNTTYSSLVQDKRAFDFEKQSLPFSQVVAKDIMTFPVFTLDIHANAEELYSHLIEKSFPYLPILNESRQLVGMVSYKTAFAYFKNKKSLSHIQALKGFTPKQLMHSPVITTHLQTPVSQLAKIMVKEKVGALPVVKDEKVEGIITRGDLLRAFSYSLAMDISG